MKQSNDKDTRSYNVGNSDYAKHKIQPWDIWKEYQLNPWDADIVKRVLRNKTGEDRRLDYEKIIHVCKERIRQLNEADTPENKSDEEEDIDGTTVMCPSELDKPRMHEESNLKHGEFKYTVYSVFKRKNNWYAYLGYSNTAKGHLYLQLTGGLLWAYMTIKGYPKATFPIISPMNNENHIYSVKIGCAGIGYVKYDYIINGGVLYRYFGFDWSTQKHRYKLFSQFGGISDVETKDMIRNEAEQETCEK